MVSSFGWFGTPAKTNHLAVTGSCHTFPPKDRAHNRKQCRPIRKRIKHEDTRSVKVCLFSFGFPSFAVWQSGTTGNPLSVASFGAERFSLVWFSACYSCFLIVSRFRAVIYQMLSLVQSFSFKRFCSTTIKRKVSKYGAR